MADSTPEAPVRDDSGTFRPLRLGLIYLPLWVAVFSGLWGLWTYVNNEREAQAAVAAQADRDSRTRLIEAQKPFLDKQLALYFETAEIAGFLATSTPSMNADSEWPKNYARFQRLYWSELSMVEHNVVEQAMVNFRQRLSAFADSGAPPTAADQAQLQQAALQLAHALRAGIQSSWGDPSANIVAPAPKP